MSSTNTSERVVIHSSYIVRITGFSKSWANSKIRAIKATLGKKKNEVVTFEEFYIYTGIKRQTELFPPQTHN